MGRIGNIAGLAAVIVLLAGVVGGAARAAETFVLSSYVTSKHWLVSQVLQQWGKDVEKETGGAVSVRILAAALGKPAAHFDMARDGVADITLSVPAYTPGRYALTMVGSLPNVGISAESVSGGLWRVYEKFPDMQKEFEGVKPLAIFTTTGLQFWNTKRPIQKMGDFRGLKMHVAGSVVSDVASALGATPVPRSTAEAYQTISSGVVDGIIFTVNGIPAFKLQKILSYGTLFPGGFSKAPILLAMNPGKFNGLPKATQDAIMRVSGEKLSRHIGKVWDGKDIPALEAVRKAGVKVTDAEPALATQITAAAEQAIDKWLANVKQKRGVDGRPFLAAFRAETKKIDAGM